MDCLAGIRVEATETPEHALGFYDDVLQADPANAVSIMMRLPEILLSVRRLSGGVKPTC